MHFKLDTGVERMSNIQDLFVVDKNAPPGTLYGINTAIKVEGTYRAVFKINGKVMGVFEHKFNIGDTIEITVRWPR